MKKQFQSKAVPRGTRTIWRYLGALILLFTFAIGQMWADSGTITAASATDLGSGKTPRYVVNVDGVGRLMKNKTGSSAWNVSNGALTTGSSMFALQTYNAITEIVIYGTGTGNNRTLSKVEVGTATNSYSEVNPKPLATVEGTDDGKFTSSSNADSMHIALDVAKDSYVAITFSGNVNITSVKFIYAGSASTDPVSSVTVAGAATGYATVPVELTATPDETATGYKWFVDGVEQDGQTAAKFNFTPATPGTYSIVAKARNTYNAENEWIASTAHTYTASKLCGELIKIVQNGQSDGNVSGILTGTKDVKLSSGTSEYDEKTGRKIGSDNYWLGVTNLSAPLRAGDVASIFVTTASANLILYSDKGVTKIGEKIGGVTQGKNDIVLTSAATGKTAIYLYRVPTSTDEHGGGNMNPFVHSLSVTRSCEASTDCSIADVTINSESVTPVGKVYSYEVAAASALTEVAVAYSIHPLATATPASGFKVAVPAAGDPANTQTITVTAEDGTHSDTYTVSVSKATAASDVVTLDALAVTGYTLSPAFDAGTLAYTITKAYGAADPASNLVTYTKTEEAQSVNVAYDSENHKFVITVTAEDNTHTQDYEITINEAEAPKSLSRVLFSNGFDAFIDNTNHTVKAYYLAGTTAPTATTITAGAGTAGALSEGKIRVTGADDSYVDYIVTLEAVTPNTTTVAEDAAAGEFAGDEAWVKNGLLVYGNTAGYDGGDGKKWYVNRRLTKSTDSEDDQRVIAGWVRSYFFVGNASKFIMTVGGNNALKYSIDGGDQVANASGTLEIALTKGNHMIEIVSAQNNGDCRLSAPKLVELPASHTVTYMPGEGTGASIVDDEAIEVADCPSSFTAPTGQVFNGWKDGDNNDVEVGAAVTTDMALTAQWINHYAVTFNMNGHGEAIDPQDIKEGAKATEPDAPIALGFDFGGWFTDNGTFEAPFDFNTSITAATPLYAKWTEFEGCALLYPALSGDALHEGDNVAVQTGSAGGSIAVVGMKEEGSISYNANGLFLSSGGADVISVTLNNDIAVGTKISVTLMAANTGSRGLNLLNATGGKVKGGTKLGWDDATLGEVGTFSYTVEASDGLEGTNIFRLQRNNSVYLQCVKVESCGAAIVYHNLNSAVDPTGKGTVTLGASSVREGYTTTAEYSEIDPLYEFVSWSVSGAGASIEDASANPATITMGTEDAVVTLNLQLIPVKFTVEYYDGTTLMGSEQVAVNENPTASEIDTDKRHYTFQGWAETDGGSVVALNTITRTEATTVNLYAVYAPVACPTEGTVFSMEFDNTKAPESTVKVAKNGGSLDLANYATLVGGAAVINNTETSDKDAISTDGKFLLKATKEVMKIELECAIATGDVIRIPDNNAKYVLSTSDSKTGTYQAQTSSQHEFEATAAWNGVDDLYILYDGSSLNFTKVYVLRPYTVSFDLQGHGDAIDAQKLVEGKKVEEPTAPTADGWDFGGWYKEAACTNAWDFDNDVVDGTMSLFAKWTEHVTNDATLKSLKYGSTAITLVDGTYEYNVELAAAVATVPALSAETNATLATKVITNATEFVAGQASSTVLVTAEDGATQLLYTVNFTKEAALPQVNVTEATVWNFATAVAGSTSMENLTDVVLANVPGITNDATFNSQALKGTFNKMPGNYFQGSKLSFTTEVPGKLTITFRGTNGNTRHLQACVGDGETVVADWVYNSSSTSQTKTIFVPAGKVTLKAFEGETPNNARIYNMIFNATPDYEREVSNNIGTLCVEHNVPAGQYFGATFYQIASRNELYNDKIDFEEVLPNEELKAGEPYIFQSTTGKIELFFGETEAENPVPVRGMIGNFDAGHLDITEENKLDILYIAKNKLWNCEDLVESGLKLNDHRAYIKMSEVWTYEVYEASKNQQNAAPRRRVTIGGDAPAVTTGIENGGLINGENGVQKVLINGQIFILRGEKMFDATGRLVK